MLLFHTIQWLRTVLQAHRFNILQIYDINYHENFDEYRKRQNIFICTSEISTVSKWLL